jgi:hypothetical protein
MNHVTTVLSSTLFVFLLAAGAVVAEPPPLPELSFYKNDAQFSKRPMTPREHTEYMKMKLAIETAGGEVDLSKLANASVGIAAESLQLVADVFLTRDDGNNEGEESHSYNFTDMAETIGEEAGEIGRLANRMGLATEAFKEELDRNSKGIDYDELHIEEGDNSLKFNFGK